MLQIRAVVTLANTCSVTWKVMATTRKSAHAQKTRSKKTVRHAPAQEETLWSRHQRDIWIVVMILAGLLLLLAEFNALGPVGHSLSSGLKLAFGVGRIAIPVLLQPVEAGPNVDDGLSRGVDGAAYVG